MIHRRRGQGYDFIQRRKAEGLPVEIKTSRLDPVLKQRWVLALRSGAYTQTRGALRRPLGHWTARTYCHCVLGVLCDILEPTGFTDDFSDRADPFSWHRFGRSDYRQKMIPNRSSMIAIGLYPSATSLLSLKNDRERWSFDRLADFIERTY